MTDVQFQIPSTYVLGPLIAAAGIVVARRLMLHAPGWTPPRAVTALACVLYAAAVADVTLFPLEVTWGTYANQTPWWDMANPIPLVHAAAGATFVLNVVLFLPFGALLPLAGRRVTSWQRAAVLGAAASVAIELTQLLLYVVCRNGRSVDIDDVIANTLGALIGYLALQGLLRAPSAADLMRTLALPGSALDSRGAGSASGF